MIFYKSPRREDVVLNSLKEIEKTIYPKVLRALKGLDEDKVNSSGILNTKLLRRPVWELKVGKIRIFYILKDNEVYILHVINKKSRKTEQLDIDIVLKRAKEIS